MPASLGRLAALDALEALDTLETLEALDALIARGEMRPDPAQRAAVSELDALAKRLDGYHPEPKRKKPAGILSRLVDATERFATT